MTDPKSFNELKNIALNVRENIIKMSTNGGCFTGASLSCTDIIVYLYCNYLNISKDKTDDPDRDYLFLSKGHDVPALYSTLGELGFFNKERLKNHLYTHDHFYWHPNMNIPGIEFYSGSLGHLLSVAIGVAYDCMLRNKKNKVIVILGDGELNEGSVWEGILVASAYRLDNLIVIIDRNFFQANLKSEELIPLEPLQEKFESFCWNNIRCDGHNFFQLDKALKKFSYCNGSPSVLIADTVRGKGLPSIEERADRWFCNFSSDEVEQLIQELHGVNPAEITSESLVVR